MRLFMIALILSVMTACTQSEERWAKNIDEMVEKLSQTLDYQMEYLDGDDSATNRIKTAFIEYETLADQTGDMAQSPEEAKKMQEVFRKKLYSLQDKQAQISEKSKKNPEKAALLLELIEETERELSKD